MLWLLQAALWKQGDGLTWTDDLPICYHPDSIGEEKVNYSSYVASVKHYGLATTYCAFDDDGYNLATRDIAEWGYDWYAVAANTVSQCGQFGRGACKATTRAAAQRQALAVLRQVESQKVESAEFELHQDRLHQRVHGHGELQEPMQRMHRAR